MIRRGRLYCDSVTSATAGDLLPTTSRIALFLVDMTKELKLTEYCLEPCERPAPWSRVSLAGNGLLKADNAALKSDLHAAIKRLDKRMDDVDVFCKLQQYRYVNSVEQRFGRGAATATCDNCARTTTPHTHTHHTQPHLHVLPLFSHCPQIL